MRFSILIPVYNVEDYVSECLDSVLCQNNTDYEVVIVNDGSTDGSLEICKSYQRDYPDKIRIISQENKGLLQARRTAIDAASGDYCLCLDSDDKIRPGALDVIGNAISSYRSDMVIYQASREVDYSEPLWTSRWFPDKSDFPMQLPLNEARKLLSESYDMNAMWNKAIKRNCIGQGDSYEGYMRLQQSEDLLQICSVLDRVRTITVLPDILYFYRPNPKSLCRLVSRKSLKDVLVAREVLANYVEGWDSSLLGYVFANTCFEYVAYLMKVYFASDAVETRIEADELLEDGEFDNFFEKADFSRLASWKKMSVHVLRYGRGRIFSRFLTCFVKAAEVVKGKSLEGYR